MQRTTKTVAALLVLAGASTIAVTGEAVVLKDTRKGPGFFDRVASAGELLTRQDGVCALRTYRREKSQAIAMPVVDERTYPCDETGKQIAATEPARATAPKSPDYYLDVEVLGYHHKVAVHAGLPIHLADAVSYAYAGACWSASDSAAVAHAIYAGNDGDAAARAVQEEAENRAPHMPASNESAQLKSGAWKYQLDLVASAPAEDGSVRLDVSGQASGPQNYDASEAGVCNGLTPHEIAEVIPATTLQMHGGGVMSDLLLGPIKFRVVKG
ncbi:hypothetical protein [Paraburkholderia youngii]|uniref:hypothetical protein n=1 Tax=Paraburkholderia youngii TaxID=2782701 RepID=UPI003D1D78EA